MALRPFHLIAGVDASDVAAIDFLSDLRHHHDLHPFLVSAHVTARGQVDDQAWLDWRIHERPTLGKFRYSIRFTARTRRTSPTSMVATVMAAPRCTLTSYTTARPADATAPYATVIEEVTTVAAPRLLLGYMFRQARAAHALTFQQLPAALRVVAGQ